jgi:antitoxin (DNA-binding transcriptional repressor) of toxin-antitoxin stability system
MTTFTLHLPRDARPGDPTALDESELVKDAFSWGAFFFTFLWFFYHRLWLAGIGVLILVFAFGGALALLDVHPLAGSIAQLLLQALIGLEANSLRRWTLTRRGRPAVDVVAAADQDEAEGKAFARWLEARPSTLPRSPASSPIQSIPRRSEPVIGLFPDAERPR